MLCLFQEFLYHLHFVRVLYLEAQQCQFLVPAQERGVHYLQGTYHDHIVWLFRPCHHVSAMLVDGGQHLQSDQMLEATCTLQSGGEDKGVET